MTLLQRLWILLALLLCAGAMLHPGLHHPRGGHFPLSTLPPGTAWCLGDLDLLLSEEAPGAAAVVAEMIVVVQLRLPFADGALEEIRQALAGHSAVVQVLGSGSLIMYVEARRAALADVFRGALAHLIQRACLLPQEAKSVPQLAGPHDVTLMLHDCLAVLSLGASPRFHRGLFSALRYHEAEATAGGFRVCCRGASCIVPRGVLQAIRDHPRVFMVEVLRRPSLHNKFSRGIMQSGKEFDEPFGTLLNIGGEGYVVGIGDTGIDTDHCFFRDDLHPLKYNVKNVDHRKILRYETYGDSGNAQSDFVPGHGTHVAGIVAGKVATPTAGTAEVATFHGMAPEARD